ncbi:hypothetical protein [Nocardia sp. NPDC057455]|uniref:hypothetical protein n=1 Tax=Nocardia sp. NPDC057455 TaxID=3346138 RepID=UPI00366D0C94
MLRAVADPTEQPAAGTCQYPAGADKMCGRNVVPRRSPKGPPPMFCDDPEHTALRAHRARQKLAKAAAAAAEREQQNADATARPISDGVGRLAALVEQLGNARDEFLAGWQDAHSLAEVISDPHALAYEVEQAQLDAEQRVALATTAANQADHDARVARSQRDHAISDRVIAVAAADEANELREAAETRLTRAQEDCARQVAAARREVDEVRAEAARQLEQLRGETARQLAEMTQRLDDERAARIRAEEQRDAAGRAADNAAAEVAQVRAEMTAIHTAQIRRLDEVHARHDAMMSEARRSADDAAREIREQHGAQLSALRDELADARRDLADTRKALDAAGRPPTGRPRTTVPKGIEQP